MVSIVVCPLAVAIQVHQTEAPSKLPAMNGSPGNCLVAPTLLPVVVTIGPVKEMALAKPSFAGAANTRRGASRASAATLRVQIRVFMCGASTTVLHLLMRKA